MQTLTTRITPGRIALALVLSAAMLTLGHADHDGSAELRIGVEGAYPPFSSISKTGELVGFDIDIAHALCEQMQHECKLVTQDWDGIIPALLAKKYDAIIASMSITEERKQKVAFSNKYYNTPAKFVRKKGTSTEITQADLQGKTVGVQSGTTHDRFITGEFGDSVTIKRYASQDEAYLDIAAGRLDLLLADSIAIKQGFLTQPQGQDFEFVGPNFSDPKYFGEGAGVAIRKQDTQLVEMFNTAIQAIRDNGTYKRINDKYFEFDVY